MKNIAIFASGSGTNAENVISHFSKSKVARVQLVLTDNPHSAVLDRADRLGVDRVVFSKLQLHSSVVGDILEDHQIDIVLLLGFLRLMPEAIIEQFEGKILNLHPALLPKFGGKGMYGRNVHAAVKAAGETETGITLHHVSTEYDSGQIIFQQSVRIDPADTVSDIEAKVRELEQHYLPAAIENFISIL